LLKSFEDRVPVPLYLLANTFSDWQKILVERQAATWPFFKREFRENPGDVPTNRKKGIKIQKRRGARASYR
jgi:hypothetical protein